jgi:hypothetical protein
VFKPSGIFETCITRNTFDWKPFFLSFILPKVSLVLQALAWSWEKCHLMNKSLMHNKFSKILHQLVFDHQVINHLLDMHFRYNFEENPKYGGDAQQ